MICLLCLDKSADTFDIFGTEGLKVNSSFIIRKHFWFKLDINSTSLAVCRTCWKYIDNFHKFYVRIENIQKSIESNNSFSEIDAKIENLQCSINSELCTTYKEIIPTKVDGSTLHYNNSTDSSESNLLRLKSKKNGKNAKSNGIFKAANSIVEEGYSKTDEDNIIAKFIRLICNLCNNSFENFSLLKKHYCITHKQKGYVYCCEKKFLRRSLLVDHAHTHLNPEYFKCHHCGKNYTTRFSLRFHISKDHEDNTIHKCSYLNCGKVFTRKETLRRHEQLHIPMKERKYKCSQCEKAYISQTSLEYHIRVVHDEIFGGICDVCGKTYNNKQNLIKHRLENHEGISKPKIQCKQCPKEFLSNYHYHTHKFQAHGLKNMQNIQHKCKYCNKISANSQSLKSHIEYMHGSKPKLKCTFCEKIFKRNIALKEHIATHTGQTLYICAHCPKTFTFRANMHHHRKRVHPKEFEDSKKERIQKLDFTKNSNIPLFK